MLSDETLEEYRKMTPSERLKLTLEMIEEGWQYMYVGSPEVVARKRELWVRENDERNQRILEALARHKENDDKQ
jgi:hypothetical protein